MQVDEYFESLSGEFEALKNRVRCMIGDSHWPTEGGWKESVLRKAVRDKIPSSVDVASGFLVAPRASGGLLESRGTSRQIDLLVYDSMTPALFKDGGMAIIQPNSARAIVEVKSKIESRGHLEDTLKKLAENAEFIYHNTSDSDLQTHAPFVGLFAYEWDGFDHKKVLEVLQDIAKDDHTRIVNHLALGPETFVRYWKNSPTSDRTEDYCTWHAYRLRKQAFGYFIHNLVHYVSHQSVDLYPRLWFPERGKEGHLVTKLPLSRRRCRRAA